MDLHNIQTYLRPIDLDEVKPWQPGWAWLAGGTWLFSEPQPNLDTIVDMQRLGWTELEVAPEGLTIGASCTMSRLAQFAYPPQWVGVKALQRAVEELASFKVQNVATIAGNLCLALPAGTFAPVMAVLDAKYELVPLNDDPYWVDALNFQTGARRTLLQPGAVLRKIQIPATYLEWQISYQRICVASAGIAVAIVVTAFNSQTQKIRSAIGAAIPAPHLITFEHVPTIEEISRALSTQISSEDWIEDTTASARYRQHVTQVLMQRSIAELLGSITL